MEPKINPFKIRLGRTTVDYVGEAYKVYGAWTCSVNGWTVWELQLKTSCRYAEKFTVQLSDCTLIHY